MNSLSALRRALKASRKSLSPATQRQASAGVIRHIRGHLRFHQARLVGSYWPNAGEIDLRQLPCNPRQTMYWPVLRETAHPWIGRGLLFATGDKMRPNRYGIPEPQNTERVSPAALDYLLIPLVGFDRQGNRLGMGGGYYDRALANLKPFRRTFKLGVAYSFQELIELEPKAWDIPLDGIVTEKELILV